MNPSLDEKMEGIVWFVSMSPSDDPPTPRAPMSSRLGVILHFFFCSQHQSDCIGHLVTTCFFVVLLIICFLQLGHLTFSQMSVRQCKRMNQVKINTFNMRQLKWVTAFIFSIIRYGWTVFLFFFFSKIGSMQANTGLSGPPGTLLISRRNDVGLQIYYH